MGEVGRLYTVAEWKAKPDKEKEFVAAWQKFATWTSKTFKASGVRLLQDGGDATKFFSFGHWDSQSSIDDWRTRPEFESFFKLAKELCDIVEPKTYKVVGEAS